MLKFLVINYKLLFFKYLKKKLLLIIRQKTGKKTKVIFYNKICILQFFIHIILLQNLHSLLVKK